nr:immunoglobulin heavy chain junction region [Macaca mulatta]MOW49098.1 immunoglobulin heavy chain junction region [Macaca mulatta]MOW50382.1 immunoglobulin heavy chain junction region [Macaca mulatta]
CTRAAYEDDNGYYVRGYYFDIW